MKRAALLFLLVALPVAAAEKWVDAYNRGVSQVRASSYQAGAQSLQQAIGEVPQENAAARVRDQIFTYTPHFWLGIAPCSSEILHSRSAISSAAQTPRSRNARKALRRRASRRRMAPSAGRCRRRWMP